MGQTTPSATMHSSAGVRARVRRMHMPVRYRARRRGAVRASRDHARISDPATGWLNRDRSVRPVLDALYRAVTKSGNPMGADQPAINAELRRSPDDETTDRVLYELEQAGYVHATVATDAQWGPLTAKLTEKWTSTRSELANHDCGRRRGEAHGTSGTSNQRGLNARGEDAVAASPRRTPQLRPRRTR